MFVLDCDINGHQVPLVGSKAATLSCLGRIGLPVPKFFAVTTEVLHAILRNAHGDRYQNVSQDLIINTIKSHTFTTDFITKLKAKLEYLNVGKCPVYAVRSSAPDEDGLRISFAGQYHSSLAVKGAAGVLEALKSCWVSLFSDKVLAYRRRYQLPVVYKMGVIVQSMIAADSAGVLFTRDPVCPSRGVGIIESTFGLSNLLMDGSITPDRFYFTLSDGSVMESSLGTKIRMCVLKKDRIFDIKTPYSLTELYSMNHSEIRSLSSLAVRIYEHFGSHQDIEWALNAGSFYILQSRPITTFKTN